MHISDLNSTMASLGNLTDMSQTEVYARQMEELEKDLKASQKQADLYNSREAGGQNISARLELSTTFSARLDLTPSCVPVTLFHFLSSTEAPLCVPVPVTTQAIPLCGAQVKELNSG